MYDIPIETITVPIGFKKNCPKNIECEENTPQNNRRELYNLTFKSFS